MVPWGIVGAGAAFVLNKIWWDNLDKAKYWEEKNRFFDWLEHYHWGTLFVILGGHAPIQLFLLGLGTILILDELLQKHRFSFGSGHLKQSSLIAIGFVIMGLVVRFLIF